MAQQIEALATKPDNLTLIAMSHVVERKNRLPANYSLTSTHEL